MKISSKDKYPTRRIRGADFNQITKRGANSI